MALLTVENVGVRFGGVVALDGLSFSVGAIQRKQDRDMAFAAFDAQIPSVIVLRP